MTVLLNAQLNFKKMDIRAHYLVKWAEKDPIMITRGSARPILPWINRNGSDWIKY